MGGGGGMSRDRVRFFLITKIFLTPPSLIRYRYISDIYPLPTSRQIGDRKVDDPLRNGDIFLKEN